MYAKVEFGEKPAAKAALHWLIAGSWELHVTSLFTIEYPANGSFSDHKNTRLPSLARAKVDAQCARSYRVSRFAARGSRFGEVTLLESRAANSEAR
jgi:hypothetical protein